MLPALRAPINKVVQGLATVCAQNRTFAESQRQTIPKLSFADVSKQLQTQKHMILLDVREKSELLTDGKIPTSKNIPLGEIPEAFKLDDETFKDKYGFSKPQTSDQIVIHCKTGIRAGHAANFLAQNGYPSLKVYSGIHDWKENGGKLE